MFSYDVYQPIISLKFQKNFVLNLTFAEQYKWHPTFPVALPKIYPNTLNISFFHQLICSLFVLY